MPGKTLLWIGCGGCSGETQAMLGVEGQVSDLVDLIDVDSLRLLWHPSLADVGSVGLSMQELLAGSGTSVRALRRGFDRSRRRRNVRYRG